MNLTDYKPLPGFQFVTKNDEVVMEHVKLASLPKVTKNEHGFMIDIPEFPGHEAVKYEVDDWSDVQIICTEAWLRYVAVKVGGGFHPDTQAKDYTPKLGKSLSFGFDKMLNIAHNIENCYKIGLNAWYLAETHPRSALVGCDDVVPYENYEPYNELDHEPVTNWIKL